MHVCLLDKVSPDVSINLVSNSIPIVAGREVDIGAFGETRRWTREVLPTPLLKEEERGGEREEERGGEREESECTF